MAMPNESSERDAYRRLGKKLKSFEDDSKKKSRDFIQNELKKLGFQPYLPRYLRTRLLSLKDFADLPLLNVPAEVFEKQGLMKKRQYYSRLATLITDVGLAYQRAHLNYPRLEDIAHALKSTFNIDLALTDIEASLALLEELHIVRKVGQQMYEFESLSTSKHVNEIIKIAAITWKEERRGCTLEDFLKTIPLDSEALKMILTELEHHGICRKLDNEYWFVGIDEQ